MKYFYYISHTKVDQLIASMESEGAESDAGSSEPASSTSDSRRSQEDEEHLIEALATVFAGRERAVLLVERAGFPRSRIPSFTTADVFWSSVVREARNGVLPGGVSPILKRAAAEYPHNSAFRGVLPSEGGKRASLKRHLLDAFGQDVSFDRTGATADERSQRQQYVTKLEILVGAIHARPGIEDLRSFTRDEELTGLYYYYVGEFRSEDVVCRDPLGGTVTVTSRLSGERQLLLDCSLRFFGEGANSGGEFQLDSINSRFFSGRIPLRMETVFVLLHARAGDVYGSPLFLGLSAKGSDAWS